MTSSPMPVVPRRRTPFWIFAIIVIYHLMVATVVAGPIVWAWFENSLLDPLIAACVGLTLMLLTIGLALFIIPVGSERPPRTARRPLWIPLLCSATLAMAVFGSCCLASHEFAFGSRNTPGADFALYAIMFALPVVWLFWLIFFRILASGMDRDRWNERLYRTLLTGSVLELLIAVPMHIVVRRRGECCGGMATGFGIGVGVVVTLIAIGPAVLILCQRRLMRRYGKSSSSESAIRDEQST